MPKSNPKHQSKKAAVIRQQEMKKRKTSKKKLWGILLFVAIFGSIIFAIIKINSEAETPIPRVEDGDRAVIQYQLWVDGQDGNSEPDGVIDWTHNDPVEEGILRDEDNPELGILVSDSVLNYDFYINILGLEEGEEYTFSLLPNVDQDHDGIDDATHHETHEYPTLLIFYKVKILELQKANDTQAESSGLLNNISGLSIPSNLQFSSLFHSLIAIDSTISFNILGTLF